MKKDKLKEMFNFTKNKKETIIIGIMLAMQLLLHTFSYPFIVQKIVDDAIPKENINVVIFLSVILIILVLIRFLMTRSSEIRRKNCYYDYYAELKYKVF